VTKNNPGKFDCYDKAHPDEPMFVLLGRDPSASRLVRIWARGREAAGETYEKVAEAYRCADAMQDWAEKIGAIDSMQNDFGGHPPVAPAPAASTSADAEMPWIVPGGEAAAPFVERAERPRFSSRDGDSGKDDWAEAHRGITYGEIEAERAGQEGT